MATIHIFTNMETAAPQQASRVFPRRMRLSTAARRSGLDPRREVLIAQRNGRWVRQRDWSQTLVGKNDVVKFVVIPGKGDTLRTVALLAVLVMAVVVAGPLGGSAWLAGAGLGLSATQAGALIIGGAMIAGSYAINALIPLPRLAHGFLDERFQTRPPLQHHSKARILDGILYPLEGPRFFPLPHMPLKVTHHSLGMLNQTPVTLLPLFLLLALRQLHNLQIQPVAFRPRHLLAVQAGINPQLLPHPLDPPVHPPQPISP